MSGDERTRRELMTMGAVRGRPPVDEVLNAREFREQARRVLPEEVYEEISGGDREPFGRMTFRPRMCVPTEDLDLTVSVLGEALYTPIVVGPLAEQRRFHPEGELATLRGAREADTISVVSSRSSVALPELAASAGKGFWFSVYVGSEGRGLAEEAVALGAGALFVTVEPPPTGESPRPLPWEEIEEVGAGLGVPFVVKGIVRPEDGREAVARGAQGVVVSNHGNGDASSPVFALPGVVDALQGETAVLVDGGFRRGTDILKALILGADAVLLGRPVLWGLAAYGAEGVRHLLRRVQNELARSTASLGVAKLDLLQPEHLRWHERATL